MLAFNFGGGSASIPPAAGLIAALHSTTMAHSATAVTGLHAVASLNACSRQLLAAQVDLEICHTRIWLLFVRAWLVVGDVDMSRVTHTHADVKMVRHIRIGS